MQTDPDVLLLESKPLRYPQCIFLHWTSLHWRAELVRLREMSPGGYTLVIQACMGEHTLDARVKSVLKEGLKDYYDVMVKALRTLGDRAPLIGFSQADHDLIVDAWQNRVRDTPAPVLPWGSA